MKRQSADGSLHRRSLLRPKPTAEVSQASLPSYEATLSASRVDTAVPVAGLEPARACAQRLAKPLRLPIPPHRNRTVADHGRTRRPARSAPQVLPSRTGMLAESTESGVTGLLRIVAKQLKRTVRRARALEPRKLTTPMSRG